MRVIKMEVHNEEIVPITTRPVSGSYTEDYKSMVPSFLDPQRPCYILFRLDSSNNLGYEWLFINWVPDESPVREKMIYAGTRSALRQEFGDGLIADTLHGTELTDLSFEGYERHRKSKSAPPPLTMAEYELEEIKAKEITHTSLDAGAVTMKGISFPLTREAEQAVQQFRDGELDYLQLKIDTSDEIIGCESPLQELSVQQLPSVISKDEQRYHLFRFRYAFEGDHKENLIFIYSLCGYKNPIKERMLYSSCKNTLLSALENGHGLQFARKIETDTPEEELTEAAFITALHPPQEDTKPKFEKPKGPGGARGPRRLIKK